MSPNEARSPAQAASPPRRDAAPRPRRSWRAWPAIPLATYLGGIPVRRRRAVLRPAAPLRLPRFRGALWHSVLGAAVKAQVCSEPSGICGPCARRATCPYPALFESRARTDGEAPLAPGAPVPGALVLDTGPWEPARIPPEEDVAVDYVLVGRPDLAAVVDEAVALAGRRGLGPTRIPATLLRTEDRGGSLVEAAEEAVRAAGGGLGLELRTPLRLKAAGQHLRVLDPVVLARDVTFRVALLGHHHAGLPWPAPWREVAADAHAARVAATRTRWVEAVRYSARQGREIVMGGLVGTVALEGVGPALARTLGVAGVLHAGKGEAVGLGALGVHAIGPPSAEPEAPGDERGER